MSQTKAQLISDLVQALNFTGTSSAPANGVYLSAANELKLATASSERLMINGDGLTVQKGVTVNGIEGGAAQIRLRADEGDDNNDMYRLLVEDGGTGLKIQGYDGSFQTRLTIDSNGKVGIGTTSPTDLLSIKAPANSLAFGGKDTIRDNHIWQLLNNDNEGNAELRLYKNSISGTHTQSINFATSGDNNYLLDGSFGIGTTTPTELLEVYSTNASTAIEISAGQTSTTTGESKLVLRSLHSSSGTAYSRSEIASLGVAGGDSDLIFRTTTDNSGPQERMRIKFNGKVGIGTDAPSETLDVAGIIRVNSASDIAMDSNAAGQIRFRGNGYTGAIALDSTAMRIYHNSASRSLILGCNESNMMTINTSGNVGIGTSSPTNKFQVNDTNPVIAEFYHSDGDTNDEARIALGAYSSNPPSQRGITLVGKNNGAGHDFIVNTSSSHSHGPTEKLRVTSDGHLFIKGQDHEVRWYRDDEARYGAVTYDGSNFNIKNPVNDHTRVCKSDGTELIKFHNNGDVLIADGDLVISTAGHGIDFSATSDATGKTSELLDDYEEGTFTPTIGFASNSANDWTYNAQQGTYLKVGNLCHFVLRIDIGNAGSGNNGWVEITGLPFGMYDMMSGISYEGTTTCDVHDAASNILGPRALFYQSANKLLLINGDTGDSFFASDRQIKKNDLIQASTDIRIRGVYRTT